MIETAVLTPSLNGVAVLPTEGVWAPQSANQVNALILGDSYVAGGGGSFKPEAFLQLVGHFLGWKNVQLFSLPGSGYVTTGVNGSTAI
ncbi:hypothetical protein [Sphingomonas nostoxanthinifaciens]|uniref:hypothetical protein n=1 Tax=Sphingomonas nostoxanthinifaciens TaxID=2872652 RepID=UPI001CC1C70E|nr:hypothetical protein [Sphingomonas nostoxanthinifaciens]UAK25658.1 hypothetical protein K8P63_05800 [Sphingomonas nostoxanthinifaciens]